MLNLAIISGILWGVTPPLWTYSLNYLDWKDCIYLYILVNFFCFGAYLIYDTKKINRQFLKINPKKDSSFLKYGLISGLIFLIECYLLFIFKSKNFLYTSIAWILPIPGAAALIAYKNKKIISLKSILCLLLVIAGLYGIK